MRALHACVLCRELGPVTRDREAVRASYRAAQQPPPRLPKESIWRGGGRVEGREAAPHSYKQKSNALKHEVWVFVFQFTALQTATAGLQLLNSLM